MSRAPQQLGDVIVVGAGMAGLTAARALAATGLDVLVLDKGRAVGGRMATRRIGSARFDHGAQHFSARSDAFHDEVERWIQSGVVGVWYQGRSVTQPDRGVEPRLVGLDGMRSVPTFLAEGLDVRTGIRVGSVSTSKGRVEVVTPGGVLIARAAIVTAPLPQAGGLLRDLDDGRLLETIDRVQYDPCLAVMAELDGPAGLVDGHAAVRSGPVAWIADNAHKGISSVSGVTIHSTAGFARDHLESDAGQWVPLLVEAALPHLSSSVVSATGHRWRFSQPQQTLDTGCLVVEGPAPIVVAGEVFAGAKVEGAYLSGSAAASAVADRLAN